jgi:hypothetical protein
VGGEDLRGGMDHRYETEKLIPAFRKSGATVYIYTFRLFRACSEDVDCDWWIFALRGGVFSFIKSKFHMNLQCLH